MNSANRASVGTIHNRLVLGFHMETIALQEVHTNLGEASMTGFSASVEIFVDRVEIRTDVNPPHGFQLTNDDGLSRPRQDQFAKHRQAPRHFLHRLRRMISISMDVVCVVVDNNVRVFDVNLAFPYLTVGILQPERLHDLDVVLRLFFLWYMAFDGIFGSVFPVGIVGIDPIFL